MGSWDGHVQLWEVATGKSLADVSPPSGGVGLRGLAFPGPHTVAFGFRGNAAVVWEVPSGKVISPEVGHRHGIAAIAFAADGNEVITSAANDGVLRWTRTGRLLGEQPLTSAGRPAVVPPDKAVTFSAPGLATHPVGGHSPWDDAGHAVYALPGGKRLFAAPTHDRRWPIAFSPDGKRMVVMEEWAGGKKGDSVRLVVIDVATAARGREITLGPGEVKEGDSALVVSPDGRTAGAVWLSEPKDEGSRILFAGVNLDTGDVLGETEWKAELPVACPDNKTVLAYLPKPHPAMFGRQDIGGELVL